jgi:signal transduction histidine kinase
MHVGAVASEPGQQELGEMIPAQALQSLMDTFYKLSPLPMAIIDLRGRVLVGVGWQEICTRFHRKHPETCRHCLESDSRLSAGVPAGEFKLYKCKNQMWDVATPILVDERHVGNVLSGQFFFKDETVDREMFLSQARRYGFDETDYLAALDRVPRISREQLENGMGFLVRLAALVSELGYSNLELARSAEQLRQSEQRMARAQVELQRLNADLERRVQDRTAKLQEAMNDLEHFSYTIAHDMRAPLRAIQGFGGIMRRELCADCPKPSNLDWLDRITASANRMDRLITDALLYSQTVQQEFNCSPVDTQALLKSLLESYPPLRASRGQIQIHGRLPWVLGNEAGLTQCFSNLLSNAVKFVQPGKQPQVRVWAEDAPGANFSGPLPSPGQAPARVRLWFEDNGIGIPPEAQGRLFQMFQRASSAYEGTGIGLALARKITERMGGRIGMESTPGQGSRFWVELRRATPPVQSKAGR